MQLLALKRGFLPKGFRKTYEPNKSKFEIQSAKVRALIEYRKIHPKNRQYEFTPDDDEEEEED